MVETNASRKNFTPAQNPKTKIGEVPAQTRRLSVSALLSPRVTKQKARLSLGINALSMVVESCDLQRQFPHNALAKRALSAFALDQKFEGFAGMATTTVTHIFANQALRFIAAEHPVTLMIRPNLFRPVDERVNRNFANRVGDFAWAIIVERTNRGQQQQHELPVVQQRNRRVFGVRYRWSRMGSGRFCVRFIEITVKDF